MPGIFSIIPRYCCLLCKPFVTQITSNRGYEKRGTSGTGVSPHICPYLTKSCEYSARMRNFRFFVYSSNYKKEDYFSSYLSIDLASSSARCSLVIIPLTLFIVRVPSEVTAATEAPERCMRSGLSIRLKFSGNMQKPRSGS